MKKAMIFLLVFIFLTGCANKAPKTDEDYISVSATEFIAAYSDNEVAADNKYKDKWLAITGTVESISKDQSDKSYVALSGNGYRNVRCYLAKNVLDSVATLKKGDIITMKGKGNGGKSDAYPHIDLQVNDCVIK